MFVRELADGDQIDQVLVVREAALRRRSDGSEFLRLSVGDRSGSVVAVASERVRELAELCERGMFMRVDGRFELHPRYGAQIALADVRAAAREEYDLDLLLDGPPRPVAGMEAALRDLIEHSLGVAEAVAVISTTFPGIDRDVAITGALLHDIGKLDTYTADPLAIDLTALGKLHGEISLGYFRIRRVIEDIPGFPP